MERCNITSDRLRFFSIGFLFTNELFLDKSPVVMEESVLKCRLLPV